jgi:hypothetical protein
MLSNAGGEMFEGVMLLWFRLAGISLLFSDRHPRHTRTPVLKRGFVLLTAYAVASPHASRKRPICAEGSTDRSFPAFLYALGCREPLPGLHERYVAARWRQTLGSSMHCVAGDGVGILAGAVLAGILGLTGAAEAILEYVLGFAFGWMIFRRCSCTRWPGLLSPLTFIPELLSMNLFMEGMVPR